MRAQALPSIAARDSCERPRTGRRATRLRRLFRYALVLLAASVSPIAAAGIGDVDPGYGVNGRFEARRYGAFFVYPPLADGRLLYPADVGYRRTDVNGLPDETFGSGGVQAWPQGYAIGGWARAGDGRLFVALRRAGPGGTEYAVLKLRPDGEPDPAFGTDGLAAIDVPADGSRTAAAFVVQHDGRLLLLLEHHDPANYYVIDGVLLVRLLPDGGRDTTFGDGGSVAVATGPVDAMDGVGLTLLADGRIGIHANTSIWLTQSGKVDVDPPDGQEWPIAAPLPGGGAIAWARTSTGYQLAKVRIDGSFDTSFGPNGDGTVNLPSEVAYLSGVGVSPDGRYIFVTWGRNSDGHWRVSRLSGDGHTAGQLDTAFGEQGTTDLKSTNASGAIYALADGGAIVTTADYAYRLLGRDAPSPGITGVDLYRVGSAESDGVAVLHVFRAAGSDGPLRLRYRTLADSELPQQSGVTYATPGVDFDAVDGVLDWSDGDSGDNAISIPLRNDQVKEGAEQIYVRFEALSPGTWTVPELVAVAVNDPPSYAAPPGGQASGGGTSSGGGSFGWPGLLLMLAVLAGPRSQRCSGAQDAVTQRS